MRLAGFLLLSLLGASAMAADRLIHTARLGTVVGEGLTVVAVGAGGGVWVRLGVGVGCGVRVRVAVGWGVSVGATVRTSRQSMASTTTARPSNSPV